MTKRKAQKRYFSYVLREGLKSLIHNVSKVIKCDTVFKELTMIVTSFITLSFIACNIPLTIYLIYRYIVDCECSINNLSNI